MSRKNRGVHPSSYSAPSDGPHAPASLAIIYQSEFDYISRCILDYPDIETGGQLFGFWTAGGVPVVLYAIGPGPRANHQVTFFNQDIDYLKAAGQAIIDRYGLQHIGEWHSHHHLGLDHPSGHDAATMATSIERLNLHRFLLCIGTCSGGRSIINPYNFHESDLYNYIAARWRVLKLDSPFRPLIDRELAGLLTHPYTREARHGNERLEQQQEIEIRPVYSPDYWLRDKSNNLELKKIVDFIADITGSTPGVQMDRSGRVSVYADTGSGERLEVFFPDGFPAEAPEISLPESLRIPPPEHPSEGIALPLARDFWEFNGDIAASFSICFDRMRGILPPPLELTMPEEEIIEEMVPEEINIENMVPEEAPAEGDNSTEKSPDAE